MFQGLHNVIGFRTEMLVDDGMNSTFGLELALGVDVNTAWFQTIEARPSYNDGQTYLDYHLNQQVQYGRASTMIDARNLGQSVFNVDAQSPATELWNFYMGN